MESTEDGHALAYAVVDTVRDSLLVLDGELNVNAASSSFYSTFTTQQTKLSVVVFKILAMENTTPLLAIEHVTVRRDAERLLKTLSDQKDTLLAKMSHRVANSLQIIAGNLLLKARCVQSAETRGHLEDAHRRMMSVAALRQQLKATGTGENNDVCD